MSTTIKKTQRDSAKRKAAFTGLPVELVPSARGKKKLALRGDLHLSRDVFTRMFPVSVRHIATIESGQKPSEALCRRLTELQRVFAALSEIIAADTIGQWIQAPNDAFDGLKPLEVIERGEIDRIWQMIFLLRSGVPS